MLGKGSVQQGPLHPLPLTSTALFLPLATSPSLHHTSSMPSSKSERAVVLHSLTNHQTPRLATLLPPPLPSSRRASTPQAVRLSPIHHHHLLLSEPAHPTLFRFLEPRNGPSRITPGNRRFKLQPHLSPRPSQAERNGFFPSPTSTTQFTRSNTFSISHQSHSQRCSSRLIIKRRQHLNLCDQPNLSRRSGSLLLSSTQSFPNSSYLHFFFKRRFINPHR